MSNVLESQHNLSNILSKEFEENSIDLENEYQIITMNNLPTV